MYAYWDALLSGTTKTRSWAIVDAILDLHGAIPFQEMIQIYSQEKKDLIDLIHECYQLMKFESATDQIVCLCLKSLFPV